MLSTILYIVSQFEGGSIVTDPSAAVDFRAGNFRLGFAFAFGIGSGDSSFLTTTLRGDCFIEAGPVDSRFLLFEGRGLRRSSISAVFADDRLEVSLSLPASSGFACPVSLIEEREGVLFARAEDVGLVELRVCRRVVERVSTIFAVSLEIRDGRISVK